MTTRRQILHIGGGMLATVAMPYLSGCASADQGVYSWEGEALGAPGFITLYGAGRKRADQAFTRAQNTIERLEDIFSLYRPHSEISRLNRDGRLENASAEMLELVHLANHISKLTNSAFDISVQVLWVLAQRLKGASLGPAELEEKWQSARALVNYQDIHIEGTDIWLGKPGMAITLNGIAQGYISEQVAIGLYRAGKNSVLVNIGEFQALGERSFQVGIQHPHNVLDIVGKVKLKNAGLATSSPLGGYLSNELSHIFEPRKAGDGAQFSSASVVHRSGAMADGLATAFTLMDENTIRAVAKKAGVIAVILVRSDGTITRF